MISIKVPPLGESIVEATVSRWLKKEGDAVAVGDTLVELETDKITVEVPAMNAGVLTKLAHAEGDVVKVDELLAEIDESRDGDGERCGAGCRRSAAAASRSAPAAAPSRPNRRNSGRTRAAPRRQRRPRFARRPPRSASPPSAASTSRRCRARDAAVS